ncbi:MAG TPA: LysR family transcriptional regulator [Candidatus Hydrogenedentes bacterium]|nr:LysR family transcriptional regulator [Candidatus Hydrogenedentota bacterium]
MDGARCAVPADVRVGVKLWLSLDGKGVFGEGKWRLLDAIHRTGSLRAAADALGISYRKAWGDLRDAERALGVTFLERRRGGAEGGESRLSDTGRKWLTEYARFRTECKLYTERAFARWKERMGT